LQPLLGGVRVDGGASIGPMFADGRGWQTAVLLSAKADRRPRTAVREMCRARGRPARSQRVHSRTLHRGKRQARQFRIPKCNRAGRSRRGDGAVLTSTPRLAIPETDQEGRRGRAVYLVTHQVGLAAASSNRTAAGVSATTRMKYLNTPSFAGAEQGGEISDRAKVGLDGAALAFHSGPPQSSWDCGI